MIGVTDAEKLEGDSVAHTLDREDGLEFRPVPLPFRPRICLENAAFAHPFEADFAHLLDFYRVPWAYEPTSFPLAWDIQGKPVMHCAPDFYLPQQRLYIELTTVRQRLVTRKHRKVRLLRNTYPNVRVRLLYHRDYERLLLSYRGSDGAFEDERPGAMVHSAEELEQRVSELALGIAETYHRCTDKKPLLILGMEPGAMVFQHRLASALARIGVPVENDRISLTPYRGNRGLRQRRVSVQARPRADLRGRHVLLLTSVVSTGLSVDFVCRWLHRNRPRAVDVCTLLDRRSARIADVDVRYVGFEAPADVLIGFGLHRRRQFRELPFIARLQLGR